MSYLIFKLKSFYTGFYSTYYQSLGISLSLEK